MIPSNVIQFQGQGQVSADNLNTYIQGCDTATQLRGFIGATGMQISLLGIGAVADGGGGLFYWASGAGYTDDNFLVIVPTGYTAGAWLRNAIAVSGGRQILTAPLQLYVDPTNGSNGNNGLTALTAFKSLQKPISVLTASYDLAGNGVFVNCASGTYNSGVIMQTPVPGGDALSIRYIGNSSNLTAANSNGFLAYGSGVGFQISGFAITTTGSGYLNNVWASSGAMIALNSGMTYNGAASNHINADFGGRIIINNSYSVGAAQPGQGAHWALNEGALIFLVPGITVSVANIGLHQFAYCTENSSLRAIGTTYSVSGSPTYLSVNVGNNGSITTAGAKNIPGSGSSITSGGQYT